MGGGAGEDWPILWNIGKYVFVRNGFRIIPPLSSVPIKLSQSSSPLLRSRRDQYPSPETGSGKGTRSGNSRLLLAAIPYTKKEREVTSSYRCFFTIHKETAIQDGDSQVRKTIDCEQRLGYLHRLDRCLSPFSDTSSIQKVSSIRLRKSDILVHGLTLRNVSVRGFLPN